MQRALRSLFDADEIPLRLAAYVMGPAPVSLPTAEDGGLEVLFAGEVRLDTLRAAERDGGRMAEPRFELLTSSLAGESHHSDWALELKLGPPRPDAGEALWHPFLTRIAMGPGSHRARLVVQSGERTGSVTVDFEVPRPGEPRLSSPILSDRLVANAAEQRVLPLARRVFPGGATLHGWVELVGAGVDPATGLSRATAEFVVRARDGSEWARGPVMAMNLERGRPTRLVSVPLAGAAAGEHELLLQVKDEVTGATFEAREPFRVEVQAAGGSYAFPAPAGPAAPGEGERAAVGLDVPAGPAPAAAATPTGGLMPAVIHDPPAVEFTAPSDRPGVAATHRRRHNRRPPARRRSGPTRTWCCST